MLKKILNQLIKATYPNRNYTLEKIGNHFFMVVCDRIGCKDYLLDGTYSYEEVVKLNAITTYNASYGYCPEVGSVAFIGIPNPKCVGINGYFLPIIHEYGSVLDEKEYSFTAYCADEEKNIKDYTVYGMYHSDSFKEISKLVKISKLSYYCDSRYEAKQIKQNKIFDMDCQIRGTYTYNQAKLLATGTTKKKESFSGKEEPILFAMVENQPIGIIGVWESDIELISGFRDVWEYGKEEPNIQRIRVLSDEEASFIKNFVLYIYDYSFVGSGKAKYDIIKKDRTLNKCFNFHLEDGTDYRLIQHNELLR